MNTTEIKVPTAGQQVSVTFLPGRPVERKLSGRAFKLDGSLVIQPAGYMSDDFLTIVMSNGEVNPNLRIDSAE